MSVADDMGTRGAVVAALRAAGCVFAEDEAALLLEAACGGRHLQAMLEQRTRGMPLEHVLGWAEFHGLRVSVDPGVFVPRRRTELLVTTAASLAEPGALVVDLCCGSGAVGLALASAVGTVELHAVDLDAAAVGCARRNLDGIGEVHLGDLVDALPARLRGHVDVLVACPPYVPSDAVALMPPEARYHEPRAALDGGSDGLDVLRRIAQAAPEWLGRHGVVVLETSRPQVTAAQGVLAERGLTATVVENRELGATALVGRRAGR